MAEIPKTMKAVCLKGLGEKNLELREVPVPRPGPGQVLCRVEAAMACASDTKLIDQGGEHSLMNGWDVEKWPVIIGHEASLTVVAQGGAGLKILFPDGTRCALQPALPVGPLRYKERYRDGAAGVNNVAVGYSLPGTFAEYVLLTEEVLSTGNLIRLPDDAIPHFGVCLSEPFSCVLAAQERNIHFRELTPRKPALPVPGVKQGGVTVIIGAGPMGLMHVELALTRRPAALVASEPLEDRRHKVKERFREKAGQTEIIAVHPDLLERTLQEVSDGRGADDVIVAVGDAALQEYSLSLLAKNGVANFFGGARPGASKIMVDTRLIHYNGISLVGTSGSGRGHIVGVLEHLKNGEINAGPYIAAVGGMGGALDLLHLVRHQSLEGKGLVYPHKNNELRLVEGWSAKEEAEFLNKN